MTTGIIVFGFKRLKCLSNTLESLKKQNAENVHVWLDKGNDLKHGACVAHVKAQHDFHLKVMDKHTGIEFMSLMGLRYMASQYDQIIVLEDDCFPTKSAVKIFKKDLDEVKDNDNIYSVYGHHFLVKAEQDYAIGRFQGWGWATTTKKLMAILPELEHVLSLKRKDYLEFAKKSLTSQVVKRLHVTPGRDCVPVIRDGQHWDSITCLVTAIRKLNHKKTSKRVIYNCGGGEDSLHFKGTMRHAPLNMILEDEVWKYFDD